MAYMSCQIGDDFKIITFFRRVFAPNSFISYEIARVEPFASCLYSIIVNVKILDVTFILLPVTAYIIFFFAVVVMDIQKGIVKSKCLWF